MAGCETVRGRLIVLMPADTGPRLSEPAIVRLENVDSQRQTVRAWGGGAKQRPVRYGPRTAQLLADHLCQSAPEETLSGLEPRRISMMMRRLEEHTGINGNAHDLRRTFATESVRNRLNLFYVQGLIGHNTLTMTRFYAEQVYSEYAIKAYKPVVTSSNQVDAEGFGRYFWRDWRLGIVWPRLKYSRRTLNLQG